MHLNIQYIYKNLTKYWSERTTCKQFFIELQEQEFKFGTLGSPKKGENCMTGSVLGTCVEMSYSASRV